MTTPADIQDATLALRATQERRLHPLSWLFVLLAQLREFALPLIALVFFGRGGGDNDWWQWVGLGAAFVLTLLAVVRYYTYRFRIEDGELVIRSGILHRNVRHIPLSRIQNVALKRNPLHRLLGVAEVRLESAVGGSSAEAQMRVLSMHDARALEALVQSRGRDASVPDEPDTVRATLLLHLPTIELLKLGLTSNRGLLLGAAGAGVLSQYSPGGIDDLIAATFKSVFGYAQGLDFDLLHWALIVGALVTLLVLVMRAVSVLLVVFQFHGFRLSELDQRLSVEAGLLTRIRSHSPLRRIQHWTVRESLVHRWLKRRSLKIETAAMQVGNKTQAISDVVPIAAPEQIDDLLQRWLPWFDPEALDWHPLHPRAWRRMLVVPAFFVTLLTAVLTYHLGWVCLVAWPPLLLLMAWRARRIAASSAWAVTDRVLVWRSGWLDRKLSFAELHKLQGLQLCSSPFDRRHRMASVVADTAGANPFGHRLELNYLPREQAKALYTRLGQQLAKSRLRW